MNLSDVITTLSIWGNTLEPEIKTSNNYKHWVSVEDLKRCVICEENYGKIWSNDGLFFATYDHYETFYEII